MKKVLCIIPARGGSKGIPRKNIKHLLGKPLITWSIEVANNSKLIDKTVLSTEDKEIKDIGLKYGIPVIDRPKEFAEDTSTMWSVINHVISTLAPKYNPNAVVVLQPTSPIRNINTIDECIKKFFKYDYGSCVTGYFLKHIPYGKKPRQRQEIKGVFYNDGNVFVIKPSLVLNGKMNNENWGYVLSSREEQIDIDEPFDFWLAEQVLKHKLSQGVFSFE